VAKLKAPLLSLGAAGAIGKSLVYFGWKGIDCVREYVIPSNPKTALQTTQRGYLTAGVAAIHAAQALAVYPLTEADQVAYSALAAAKGKIITWFNQVVKLWCDVKLAVKVPVIYTGCNVSDKTANSINLFMCINEETGSTLADGKIYFGTSKTNLIHSKVAAITAGSHLLLTDSDCSAFLTAGTKYYWQFRPDSGDGCVGADSGIYSFVAE